VRPLLPVLLGCAALACSNPTTERLDERVEHPDAEPIAPHDECTVTTYREPAPSRSHVEPCSDLRFASHPPTGGDHFGVWASFGSYDAPVPWGFLVHSMEHGAVVLAYRCEGPCDDVRAELEAIAGSVDDPVCRDEDTLARVIVVPDPDLEQPIAAVAWEHAYLATCLDPPSLRAFVEANLGNAPESLCVPGVDRAAEGWCP
jgi:hypothetical protein